MSKNDMVMVPRELAQFIVDGGYCWPEAMGKLEAILNKPAEQHQTDPVALPARLDTAQMDGYQSPYDRGWNACLDEIAKLGPLYSRPVQGEPVAWFMPELMDDKTIIGSKVKAGPFTFPLYTHADPVEVERLREENRVLQKQLGERWTDISTLESQLAERDALLEEAYQHDIGTTLKRKIRAQHAALSASAEPSAPVEVDERAELRVHLEAMCKLWPEDISDDGSGRMGFKPEVIKTVIKARAALERKPS